MFKRENELPVPDSFEFPFEPYQIQREFMEQLYKVIESRQIGIFESPTGTGKTLSLTCGALKWLLDDERELRAELKTRQINLLREVDHKESENSWKKDWLDSQYETILLREDLKRLKIVHEIVQKHDRALLEMKNKRKRKRKLMNLKQFPKQIDEPEITNPNIMDFDLENEDESDDKNSSDEEKDSEEVQRYSKIFFCSRTHSQLTQVLNEIKGTNFGAKIRLTTLASRGSYCVNEDVRKGAIQAVINERCLDLKKNSSISNQSEVPNKKSRKGACPYYSKEKIENLREEILTEVRDIEDLVSLGKQEKACPYYASRQAANDAQIVLLPYQILFHKPTRIQSGIDIKDAVIIVDEAHNLMDTISAIHSTEVSLEQLKCAKSQLCSYRVKYQNRFKSSSLLKINQIEYICKQLIRILSQKDVAHKMVLTYDLMAEGEFFNLDLFELLSFCEKSRLAQKVHGLAQQMARNVEPIVEAPKSLLKVLEERQQQHSKKATLAEGTAKVVVLSNANPREFVSQALRNVLQFLESFLEKVSDGRILIEAGVKMKYLLLNCNAHFQDILSECRSLIVAGGTMKPIDELTDQLFVAEQHRIRDFSFNHVVPKDAILPIIIPKGPAGNRFLFNYATKLDRNLLKDLSMCLLNVCNLVPAGVVVFFGSYDYLNVVYKFMKDEEIIEKIAAKKTVFVEPKQQGQTEKILVDFARAIRSDKKRGALLLSVVGGKLSEGLNFSDDLGRCVIVVGMPYPNKTSPELAEKMKYLDSNLRQGAGSEYYENICMKAVNQCIGRAVRHIADYAAVLLLDERYQRDRVVSKLPTWIRNSLQTPTGFEPVLSQLLEPFFRNKSVQK